MDKTVFVVKGISNDDPPHTVSLAELVFLLEKEMVTLKATKIRGAIQLALAEFYNDGMGGASGHSGESAERIRNQRDEPSKTGDI
jgi:hypothetical protein